ncbi:MAG TPA: FtsX-like permease family protein [Bryobacteraceae bacterium]|nr:FtsX-like permease family protein [Bryobacteraceae bacterium]
MRPNTFELFVAMRYLRAKRKQTVISVITVISIIGVAAGVMALVIGIAINNGFRTTLQRSLLGATAHVMLLKKDPSQGISNWAELDPKLQQIPHVISVSPVLYGKVVLYGALGVSQVEGGQLKGIPPDAPGDILRHLKEGSFDGLKNTAGLPGIILGTNLAQKTGALLNSVLTVVSPQEVMTPMGMHIQLIPYKFRVIGIFESGFFDVDSFWAFTSLDSAQQIFNSGPVVNTIELRLDDIYQAQQVADAAEKIAGSSMGAKTWMEQFQQILGALNSEKVVTALTIGLIQLVAALNILITLIMMVVEKNRDIAVLMSMGAKRQQIRKIFVVEGLLIGVVGTLIGLVLGYSLSFLAGHYHWLRLNAEVYSLPYVPFSARWQDGIWIAATAIFVSFIATLYPARSATRIAPVEALRYE